MHESATSKAGKIVLLAATLWPVLYMLLFFGFIFAMVTSIPKGGSAGTGPGQWFVDLFVVHIGTMLWCIALTVFYVVDVFQNDRVAKDQKVLWLIVILMGGFIGMPIYWYLFIWRDPQPSGIVAG
jgi:hypothetical protein